MENKAKKTINRINEKLKYQRMNSITENLNIKEFLC